MMTTLVPAVTNFGTPTEKVLTDGTLFYCGEPGCMAVGETFQSIGSQHRRTAHPDPERKRRPSAVTSPTLGEALRALAEQADSNAETDALREQVKEWKSRALAAEKQLKQLRKIVGGVLA